MSYRRDFTIGLKETQDFYLCLMLSSWWKGILGFGAAGALAGIMYTVQGTLSLPLRALAVVGGAAAGAVASALVLILSTRWKVRSRVARSGRTSYVQETEINGFGVHVTVGKDRAKMGFEDLTRVWETRKAFYLFISDQQAWILPKGQMEDPQAECAQLRDLFRTVVERGRLRLLA